jgi:hypothetical protein
MRKIFTFLIALASIALGAYTSASAQSIGFRTAILSKPASNFDPATTAWVAQVVTNGGSVSGTRKTVVDTFIKCVKSASLWTTLDRYWLYAGENTQSALTDMVNLQSASNVGGATFTANVGYVTNNTGQYVDTLYIPNTSAVNYTLNSASAGVVIQTNRTVGANVVEFGGSDAAFTHVTDLNGLDGAGNAGAAINATPDSGTNASATAKGSWLASRTGASTGEIYLNGTGLFAVTHTAAGLPDHSIVMGALNQGGSIGNFTTDQYSSFFAGAGMNATQAGNFETCQNAMMTSIGINVH